MATGRIGMGVVAAAVTAALVAGIWSVGGPWAARQDRLDAARYDEIRNLAVLLSCQDWQISAPELPETLTLEALRGYCGGRDVWPDDLTDDETGEPYRYERLDERRFRICADFTDTDAIERLGLHIGRSGAAFDPETGCVSGENV